MGSEWKWGKLSKKQLKVFKWWVKGSPYEHYNGVIADGSIRAGKTVSMGEAFAIWVMESFDGQNVAMCGKTIQALNRNVIVNMKRQLRTEGYSCVERRSSNSMVVSKGGKANTFYFFGGKDEQSQDLIQGITLAGAYFDEVALMPESFVNQATARCSVTGSKYWFNCNPAGPQHWFKTKWIDMHEEKKLVYLHFTMEDNLTLAPDIRERYEGMYKGVFYKRYILGLWAVAEGLIYDMFDNEKNVLHSTPYLYGDWYVSSDYGIQNATTFLLWRRRADTGAYVCVREYFYSGRESSRQKTVDELVDGLESILVDSEGNEIIPKQIIVDPSAAALIAELRKRRYKVRKAKNDVLPGITDVGTLLADGSLQFMDGCKHTIREFGLYAWDQKAADRGEDKPIKTDDHCMDAVRYLVNTLGLVKHKDREVTKGNLMYL